MPEMFEAGYFFPCYIWFFIVIITLLHGPDGLNVIGLWSDLSTWECMAGSTSNYPASNFTKSRFMGIILQCVVRVPLPWHRHTLLGQIPYQIGTTPSKSGLVVKLNHHMPELFRGCDPNPTNTKKKKARSVSPVQSNVSDSDDEDIDAAAIIQQSNDMEFKDLTVPSQPPKASQGEGTDLLRYFWPCCALPVLPSTALSACDAISSAGMRLVNLVYDARKTIMNLGTVFVEIYIRKQWNGITQVPRGVRFARHLAIIASSIMVAAYSQGPTKEEGEEADLHHQIQNQIGIQAKFDCSHPWLFSLIYIHIITRSSISIHVHVIIRFCGAI
ncbi:hypothetical protein B0H10DRAFT_1949477 [Mycena sp. CBHHK59/15]|nr:hypothetical protein B0H10DRAFT_1949477 [Mycena sp. CBHHK59/15]